VYAHSIPQAAQPPLTQAVSKLYSMACRGVGSHLHAEVDKACRA
jgi:hypothetical protein